VHARPRARIAAALALVLPRAARDPTKAPRRYVLLGDATGVRAFDRAIATARARRG